MFIENIQRLEIRNINSKKAVKPRLFDAIIDGDVIKLEVKTNKSTEVIDINDIFKQINEFQFTKLQIAEP